MAYKYQKSPSAPMAEEAFLCLKQDQFKVAVLLGG